LGFALIETFGFLSSKDPVDNATATISGSARTFMQPL
jgi:hypothetical protein